MKRNLRWFALTILLGTSAQLQAETSVQRQGQSLDAQRSDQGNLWRSTAEPVQPPPPQAEPEPLQVDERPLWKLREQGRHQALKQEIEHLRTAYPGWQPPPELLQVDERPLWQLREQGKLAELRQRIDQLKIAYPDWRTPAALLQAPTQPVDPARQAQAQEKTRATQAIETSIADGDDRALLRLAATHPGLFQCRRIDFLWALGDAWRKQGKTDKLHGLYRHVISRCANAGHRVTTLQKALDALPPAQFGELLALEQQRGGRNPAQQTAVAELLYTHGRDRLLNSEPDAFESELNTLKTAITQRRDADTALAVAWRLFDRQAFTAAEPWFEQTTNWDPANPDARYGLALCRFKQGRLDAAEHTLQEAADPRSQALLADIYLSRAGSAAELGDPETSNRWLDKAAQQVPPDRQQALLRAWNDHALQQYDTAADGFLAAYDERAGDDAAEGLAIALGDAGRWDDLQTLATDRGGALQQKWRQAESTRLAQRGLHQAAYHLSPDMDPRLVGQNSPQLTLGFGVRDKRGDPGRSQLRIEQRPLAAGEWRWDNQRLGLSLSRIRLDSGELPQDAPFGGFDENAAWIRTPETAGDVGLEPRLWWRSEGWTTWQAELGMTALDGAVSSALLGRLTRLQQTRDGHWQAELFLEPLRESLLSYTGAVDPYTGQTWGRVRKWGLGLAANQTLDSRWQWSAALELAGYDGEQVADNRSLSLNLGLARELELGGFDYFTLGPELSYQAFEQNLSHFTLGHGGYFSPQQRIAIGLAAGFQRQNGRYALGGRLYAGWADQHQAASPCFPLGALPPPSRGLCADGFAAADDQGIEISGQVSLALRLSDQAQLLLGLVGRDGINYQDRAGLIGVRWHLDRRPSVLSSDLPQSWLHSLF